MKLVKVLDLVGRDLAGMTADVRCRNGSGELFYPDTQEKTRTLIGVEKRTERNGVWDYSVKPPAYSKRPFVWFTLRWEKSPQGTAYDCGYAGRREDCDSLQDWHILIEKEAV